MDPVPDLEFGARIQTVERWSREGMVADAGAICEQMEPEYGASIPRYLRHMTWRILRHAADLCPVPWLTL